MSAAHPAPWFAKIEDKDSGGIYIEGTREKGKAIIAEVFHPSRVDTWDIDTHALMIAAAPTMLEALRAIAGWRTADPEILRVARAAIAKAEGKS